MLETRKINFENLETKCNYLLKFQDYKNSFLKLRDQTHKTKYIALNFNNFRNLVNKIKNLISYKLK